MSSGLNLNIKTQNSNWFRAPSPSKSPSRTIEWRSSSLNPCSPSKAEFLLRLSNVMTPFSRSFNRLKPLQSSSIRPSPPSFPAMMGKQSWKWVWEFCAAIADKTERDVRYRELRENERRERWVKVELRKEIYKEERRRGIGFSKKEGEHWRQLSYRSRRRKVGHQGFRRRSQKGKTVNTEIWK